MGASGVDVGLRMSCVSMSYGTKVALDHVSLDLHGGRIVGLLGANGAGKSTLINLAAGVLSPTRGTVDRAGGQVGWCSQRLMIDWFVSVRRNIWLGARLSGAVGREAWERTESAVRMVGLEDAGLDQTPEALSGGQQQRLMIARVLAMDTPIMLLDEPTVGLDLASLDRLRRAFLAVRDTGALIVVSSHDFAAVNAILDDVIVLDHGRVLFEGSRDRFVKRYAQNERITITASAPFRETFLNTLEGDYSLSDDGLKLTVSNEIGRPMGSLLGAVEGSGVSISDCFREPATLEDAMRRINEEKHQ